MQLQKSTGKNGHHLPEGSVKKCPLDSPVFLTCALLEERAEKILECLQEALKSDALAHPLKLVRNRSRSLRVDYKLEPLKSKDPVLLLNTNGFRIMLGSRSIPLSSPDAGCLLVLAGFDLEVFKVSCEKLSHIVEGNAYLPSPRRNYDKAEISRRGEVDKEIRRTVKTVEALLRDKAFIRYMCQGISASHSPEWCSLHQSLVSKFSRVENATWEKIPHFKSILADAGAPQNMHLVRRSFLDQAFMLGDCFYLKPTSHSGGEGVMRVERVGIDAWQIGTDCPKAGYAFQFHENFVFQNPLKFTLWLGRSTARFYADLLVHPDYHYTSKTHSKESLTGVLESFLKNSILSHPHWIAEREIHGAKWHDRKCELRCVFRPLEPNGSFSLLGHYMKVSGKTVAGNISKGGLAIETEEAYVGLLRRIFGKETLVSQVRKVAKSEMLKAFSDAEDTLGQFMGEVAKLCSIGECDPADVAARLRPMMTQVGVDFVPVWNFEKSSFENFIMEIQSGCGVSGLKIVNRHSWQRVSKGPNYRVAI